KTRWKVMGRSLMLDSARVSLALRAARPPHSSLPRLPLRKPAGAPGLLPPVRGHAFLRGLPPGLPPRSPARSPRHPGGAPLVSPVRVDPAQGHREQRIRASGGHPTPEANGAREIRAHLGLRTAPEGVAAARGFVGG